MFMLRDDGTRVESEARDSLDEQVDFDDEKNEGEVDEDHNSNSVLVGDQSLCRVCGKSIVGDKRTMEKSKKHLPRAFKNLYSIDVMKEAVFFPNLVHQKCSRALERTLKKFDKHSPGLSTPVLVSFVKGVTKCTGCNRVNPGHDRASCPSQPQKATRKKRQNLMDLKNRDQGNKRCKEWYDYTKDYCDKNGETPADMLAFTLRRILIGQGEKTKAELLENVLRGSKTGFEAFSPKTTFARTVISGRSINQYKDDYKFGRQNKKQTLARPDQVDLEKHRINQKNVSFKLTHSENTFEYIAPSKPVWPTSTPGWSGKDPEDKKTQWKIYKTELKTYKNLLRPNQINPPSDLPESLRPDFHAVGNPYANIVAFSLHDIRGDLVESLQSHPEVEVKDGVLTVDVIGSDGCDGAAGYGMMSKASDRDIPDHSLAYDFGITEISSRTADSKKVVLYDSKKVSVYSLQPVLRAACNENNHYSTHSLTIPIETARKHLCESSMEINISDKLILRTNSIEIVTSKVDKKYQDEQGGTGEGNFPCNLCTSSKAEIMSIKCIDQGFALNRTCADGHAAAESRRVNIDKATQDRIKEQSKGWKAVPMLSSEYVRNGFDDLHDCTSWGRWLVKIAIRFRAGIFSERITADLKPLFDTAKKHLRDFLLRSLGIDIHMDLKGREAQALFALKNRLIVEKLVPEKYEEEWCHFLSEARFALAIVCSPDPAQHFELNNAEPRLKSFQLWLRKTWPSFIQPDYVHPTLMHTIQLLTRPGALKSISQYGTQNKEAKNQKNNQYLATMARMTSFREALEDVYIRDSQASSVEVKKFGATKPVQHCSKCKELGHRAPECDKRHGNQKFVDLNLLDTTYRVRNEVTESDSDKEPQDHEHVDSDDGLEQDEGLERQGDVNSNIALEETPRRRRVHFEENQNESPAHRTRSKTKTQQEVEYTTEQQYRASRKLNL